MCCTSSRPAMPNVLSNIHRRNDEKPPGIYWGYVSDETFHAVTAYFAPPRPEEGFRVLAHPHR
jgi:hypothetical protein